MNFDQFQQQVDDLVDALRASVEAEIAEKDALIEELNLVIDQPQNEVTIPPGAYSLEVRQSEDSFTIELTPDV